MHAGAAEPISFKFKWVDEAGNEKGFLRSKGSLEGETLTLDDTNIPIALISECVVRDKKLIFSAMSDEGPLVAAIAVPPTTAAKLKSRMDVARSAHWAEVHKEELDKKGEGHTFRSETCQLCDATLILSDMPQTPQLYCHFCNTLTTVEPGVAPPTGEQHLKLCDECGMFSSPSKFTIFYFYFLLVVYGFWSRPTWRCPACMRPDAWKMFFGNLLFVVGVPVAVIQLVRSYRGNVVGGPFRGLDRANIKIRKGKVLAALEDYRTILDRVPYSAGIKYNLGLGLIAQKDLTRAAGMFESALQDCSN